ncbi:MAG: M20/M25/M40 family metallo-hydrolase [Terriglobales bacterium]
MDLFHLTRRLVDIESVTGNEAGVADFLAHELSGLGYRVEEMPVEGRRFNVFATPPNTLEPPLVFSTHMDTVPPFFPSSEDAEKVHGRGSCDAKGIIACQIAAALNLREQKIAAGLLFLVGEERDSLGARVANQRTPGSKFLINGEPTENRLAIASKGTLRVELVARGRMAHSAYPELGESAIEKLLDALARVRALPLPSDPDIGPCTVNIGLIEGGRAPNVIPDEARAHLLYRLIGPSDDLRRRLVEAAGTLAEVEIGLELPCVRQRSVNGLPTMVAAFTTDVPALTNWGEPLLVGPGSIHVAHTDSEYVEKKQLRDAVDLYCALARKLLG